MMSCCPILLIFGLISAPSPVGGCSVHPTSVVVVVGEGVHLNCTAHGHGSKITSWKLKPGLRENDFETPIYTATSYNKDNTSTPENVTDGYSVTHPAGADNVTILHMNKTILSQAGLYVCICNSRDTAATTVVVLDSEPKFTTDKCGADGEPVTFSCSVSFNAYSDVSCELRIEDASGSTVARSKDSTVNKGLIVCNLKHTIIANASADQWHTCNVTLSSNDDGVFYSRVLNATVECREETSKSLTTGLSGGMVAVIVVGVVVVVVVVVVVGIVYRKQIKNCIKRSD